MSQLLRTYSRKGKRTSRDASGSTNTSPGGTLKSRKRQRIKGEDLEHAVSSDEECFSHSSNARSQGMHSTLIMLDSRIASLFLHVRVISDSLKQLAFRTKTQRLPNTQ